MSKLGLAGNILGAGIRAFGDARSAKRRADFYGDLADRGESEAKKAKKARDSFGLGDTYRRYLNFAMQDPMADLRRQQEERRQSSNLGALQSGGARALIGGLQAQSQGASDRMNKISADEAARRASAFQAVGQAEQQVLSRKATFADKDLGAARSLAGKGLMGEFSANEAKKRAGNDFLAGLFSSAGAAEEAFAKNGMKTPGEFSHESNPLDVMQGGAKVAEMTGGEYVINPDQAKKIAEQSKFAAMLFKSFDKESA